MTIADKRARLGLENDPRYMDRDFFWRNVRVLERINQDNDEARASQAVVDHLQAYTGTQEFGQLPEAEATAKYEHYRSCISAAQRETKTYFDEMLVGDLRQRLSQVDELTGVTDPLTLIDMMLTSKVQVTRYEVRRALHLGALYYEYDERIGREAELHDIIHGVEMYLAATMFIGSKTTDVDLYHGVTSAEDDMERLEPTSIRIPAFGDGGLRRRKGENKVQLSFREFPDPADHERTLHMIMERRLKGRFSAALKAVRQGIPISGVRDVIGLAMYVDHRDNQELHHVVNRLEQLFDINPQGRRVHPLRRATAGPGTAFRNPFSHNFEIERMRAILHPEALLNQRELIDEALRKFFSSPRSQDAFWRKIEERRHKRYPLEMQVGTLGDMIRYNLAGGHENHHVYKVTQAHDTEKGNGGRAILEMLAPQKLYGIDWSSPEIVEVLRAKQIAQLGLHRKILERLGTD